jgi:hypothetical protein
MSVGNVLATGGGVGDGLTKQGTVIADPALIKEGIYNFDASGGAFDFTLPAATGSQERYTLVGEVFGNDVTVKVQVGETLNSTTNGTQIINTVGSIWHAMDRATGIWDIYQANFIVPTLHVFSLTPLAINKSLLDENGSGSSVGTQPRVILNSGTAANYRLYDPYLLLDSNGMDLVIQQSGMYEVVFGHRATSTLLSQMSIRLDGVELVHSDAPVQSGSGQVKTTSKETQAVIFPATTGQIVNMVQEGSSGDPYNVHMALKQLT